MRHYDLSPLYRSTVGFDKLFSMLDSVAGPDGAAPAYPPYNIERLGENVYRISMAVAGFTEADLSIEGERKCADCCWREKRRSQCGERLSASRHRFPRF